jgi:phosphomannomutase
MAPKFGTSGLRGLVTDLTAPLVADHVRAFIAACPTGTGLWVGRDLRASSPALAECVLAAARAAGLRTVDAGALPTPALALAAMADGAAAVMVTGSHIPADRNGLKFYTPEGEITKAHEAAILGQLGKTRAEHPAPPTIRDTRAGDAWIARVVDGFGDGFGADALPILRVGVWMHSAVSGDLMVRALRALGAKVFDFGRSDAFIPVDTEALDDDTRRKLRDWVLANRLDALISTDGDGDRPLLVDDHGEVVPGDVLGQITAAVLGADTIVTPVSSNTGAEASGRFGRVIRTRIGSPFVIAGMQAAGGRVAGYEANGGFLLGFEAQGPSGPLPPLATRDSLLPLVAALYEGRRLGRLSRRVAQEPARFTAADRLEETPTDASQALMAGFDAQPDSLRAFLAMLDEASALVDQTDGLRITLASGRILHMRPSGNAPEFRLYVEAESPEAAQDLLRRGLTALAARLR